MGGFQTIFLIENHSWELKKRQIPMFASQEALLEQVWVRPEIWIFNEYARWWWFRWASISKFSILSQYRGSRFYLPEKPVQELLGLGRSWWIEKEFPAWFWTKRIPTPLVIFISRYWYFYGLPLLSRSMNSFENDQEGVMLLKDMFELGNGVRWREGKMRTKEKK